jgi:hypothetical protein
MRYFEKMIRNLKFPIYFKMIFLCLSILGTVDVLKLIHVNYKRVILRLERGIHKKNIEKWISAFAGMTKQPIHGLTEDQHALVKKQFELKYV